MLLPRTEPVFDGLRTSFLRFDGLLSELRADGHSGFVSVEFPGYSGAILVDGGDAISAMEHIGAVESHGAAALRGIVTRACEPGGIVGVFRLSSAFVQLAATIGLGAPVYRDLSSSFTSLERLLTKLEDDRFDGYIEAVFSEPPAAGLVFLRGGEVSESLFEQGGTVESGTAAVARIVAEASDHEALFHVIHTNAAAHAAAKIAGETPAAAPVAEARPAPIAAIAGPLAVWSEILRRAEEVVDGISQKGTFVAALQEAFKERAAAYPYLDPTVAEFSYRDGTATFHGDVVPDSLPDALTNSLHDAIARLAFRLKRSDIESRVRAELSEVRSRHSAAFHGFPASARSLVS